MPNAPRGSSAHADTFCRDHLPPRELSLNGCVAQARLSRPIELRDEHARSQRDRRQRRPHALYSQAAAGPIATCSEWRTASRTFLVATTSGVVPGDGAAARANSPMVVGVLGSPIVKAGAVASVHHAAPACPQTHATSPTRPRSRSRYATRASPRSARRPWARRLRDAARWRRAARAVRVERARLARDADDRQAGDVRELRHRRGRHRAHRVHLRHDRQRERHDALSTATSWRSATASRGRWRSCRATTSARLAAVRLHLRARRTRALPMRFGAVAPARAGGASTAHQGDPAFGRRCAGRPADRLPRDARHAGPSTTCRRSRSASPRASTFRARRSRRGRTRRASGSSTALGRPKCCTSSSPRAATTSRPGSTGRVVPGYEARCVDGKAPRCRLGEIGRLAVRGPTGCRYLGDAERQRGLRRERLEHHRRHLPRRTTRATSGTSRARTT